MKINKSLFVPALAFALCSGTAQASMFEGEALDKVADVMSRVVLVLLPMVFIYMFWMVHIMPEKIAHQRHHPQKDAIQTLYILSLFSGGYLKAQAQYADAVQREAALAYGAAALGALKQVEASLSADIAYQLIRAEQARQRVALLLALGGSWNASSAPAAR